MSRINNIITGDFKIDNSPKRGNFKDFTGMRFGPLLVLGLSHLTKKASFWFCKCDCGNIVRVRASGFKQNKTTECCCRYPIQKDDYGIKSAHKAWNSMTQRCLNPKHDCYKDYGGRGITVCEKWLKFKGFLDDMGPKPGKNLSLDRIDNNKGYYKENCRWATWDTQSNNKRNNKYLTHNGLTMTIAQWSAHLGISKYIINGRFQLGWSVERALTQAVVRRK